MSTSRSCASAASSSSPLKTSAELERLRALAAEVALAAGSLGVSSLVCLLNNGNQGQTETTANLMGPFWRMASPRVDNGGSIVRSPTPGVPIFVNAWVRDTQGRPVSQGRALLRYFLAWIWFLPPLAVLAPMRLPAGEMVVLTLGWVGVWALLSRFQPQRQFWHDVVAGTRLVPAPRA